MPQPEKPQRPGAESEALEVSLAGDTLIVVRCRCCRRALRAPLSVRLEMGPVCRVTAA
jgi:hypothetical protein